jgi:L-ascorbate metabolism protein UlaG (beta-lactamase superfamily)
LKLTYVGGPTALLEWQGRRLLTDPTFDPAGTRYELPAYTLAKTQAPAVAPEQLGRLDVVLLSHDHHFDNLDHAGRALLPRAGSVVTTRDGAARLGDAHGLDPITLTGAEAVEVARAMPDAAIVPLHFEGWEHFTESRAEVDAAFSGAGLASRLHWPQAGEPITLS